MTPDHNFNVMQLSKKLANLTMVACIAVSFSLVPYTTGYAQEGGESGGGNGGAEDRGARGQGVNRDATKSFVKDMETAKAQCINLPIEYRADCLAQAFKEAGAKVKKKAYDPVKTELQSAGQSIDEIILANLDELAPVIKVGNKTYRPVKKEAVEAVNQQVTQVVTETATRLLRSAGKSVTRKIHFQRIAKAVDSTKVLLRSA